jgi:hypothetical protein
MINTIIMNLYYNGFCDEIKKILEKSSMSIEDKTLHFLFYYSCQLRKLSEQHLDTRTLCVEIKNFILQNKEILKKIKSNALFENTFSNTLYFLEVLEKHGLISPDEEDIIHQLISTLDIYDVNVTSHFITYFNQLYATRQFDLAKDLVQKYLSKYLSHVAWRFHPSYETLQPDILEKLQKLGFKTQVDKKGRIQFLD